ncbi:alpha-tocopherol transfer protein-like [Trichonephila inaurata madagascariensis]|uniref:Alpha-tocopherol transfer protein-like n=1 Tax=Trichonephila inaurata madagascariensis TaxID=2747483 RepID=A0A8X7CA39_9ARAC|nr:alpha-tocopherol transfer protein-like [Trichonephila inaurata madagascariensis]
MPTRVKGLQIIHESFIVRIAWPVMKQFMSEKIRNRVLFHSKNEDPYKYFPPSVLPAKYGGEVLSSHMQEGFEWIKKVNKEH